MQSKRGAEIALNVVVVAAIGLLVLAVIIFIFGGKAALFSKGTSSCEDLGGSCEANPCGQLEPPRPSILASNCGDVSEDTPYCCSNALQ